MVLVLLPVELENDEHAIGQHLGVLRPFLRAPERAVRPRHVLDGHDLDVGRIGALPLGEVGDRGLFVGRI